MEASITIDAAKGKSIYARFHPPLLINSVLCPVLKSLSAYDPLVDFTVGADQLLLSTTNISKTGWAGLTLNKNFFESYHGHPVGSQNEYIGSVPAKLFLHPLRIATAPSSSVLAIRISIDYPNKPRSAPNSSDDSDDEADPNSIEWRFLVRLICEHGVRKTWCTPVLQSDNYHVYPEARLASEGPRQTIVANHRSMNIINKHLKPFASKADGQVQLWVYDNELIFSTATRDVSAAVSIHADDFLEYSGTPETSLNFHVLEFEATMDCCSSLKRAATLHFTSPPAPLAIQIHSDAIDDAGNHVWKFLCVIATDPPQCEPPKRFHATPEIKEWYMDEDPIEDADKLDTIDSAHDDSTAFPHPLTGTTPQAENGMQPPDVTNQSVALFPPVVLDTILDIDDDHLTHALEGSATSPAGTQMRPVHSNIPADSTR